MPVIFQGLQVGNDALVGADQMTAALTAGTLVFDDGATQVFTAGGHTTYTERGRANLGTWRAADAGTFVSF